MKKLFIGFVVFLVSAVGISFKLVNQQERKIDEVNQKELEVITENVEDITEVENKQSEEKITEETTEKTESVVSQKEVKKEETNTSNDKEHSQDYLTSISENLVKQEQKASSSEKVESKTETKQEVTVEKPQEEIIIEEKQVDEEYEKLLKEVEYVTYDECMKAGFDIAFSDTVNILGFDPVEIIYKGKVIGYKLKIHYTNPMEN